MRHKAAIIGITLLLSLQSAAWVWAADVQTVNSQEGTEAAETENILTLEEALKKAEKNSTSLRGVEDKKDYLDELYEYWYDRGYKVPTASYKQWVNDGIYSAVTSQQSLQSDKQMTRYTEAITKLSIEATIRDYFSSAQSNESALQLAKEKMEMQKSLYEQGQKKYQYGIINKQDLQNLKTNYETAQDNIKSIENTMAQQKRSFYQMIGESEEKNYTLVYEVEYEPYTMNQTMEQYINERLKKDYTILQQEQNLKDAEFTMNYRPESITYTEAQTRDYNYDEAKRSLKTAKDDKRFAIQNAYDKIIELEDSYDSALTALENAEWNLLVAEKNYELGKITELEWKQKELEVKEAENNLQQIIYAHDTQIYCFEHTELLSNQTGA